MRIREEALIKLLSAKGAKWCPPQAGKISTLSKKEIIASHFAFASIVEELDPINPLYFIDVNGSKVV